MYLRSLSFVNHQCFCGLQEFPINPKALSLGELYGEFDLNTNEWTDGVLSSVMRQTCSGMCLTEFGQLIFSIHFMQSYRVGF